MADRRSVDSPRGSAGRVIATPKSGTAARWNTFEMPGYKRLNLPGNAKSPKFARGDLTSGSRQVFRGLGSTYSVEMHLIGWRTLVADQYAVSALVRTLALQVTAQAGVMVRDSALEDKAWTDRSYDTRNSMLNDPLVMVRGQDIIAEMGPTTFYAPFLEFGWQKGGDYYAFPFMIPALNKHTIDFINGHIDVMGIVAGERPFALRPPMTKSTQGAIGRARSFLYSREKALGDVVVIGGSKYISPLRSGMLAAAKELGDLNAVMKGEVVRRVATRITGSVTGRALGYTRTVSVSKTYSGTPGGQTSVGGRVYNRVAGRATRPIATGLF